MPLGPVWEENDTTPVTLQHTDGADQNPYYGRVLYTPGLQVDQPVAVTRVGYHDQPVSNTTPTAWPAFTLSLFWNSRGQAALGAFSDGAAVRQLTPGAGPCSTGSDAQRCVRVFWPTNWAAYDPQSGQTVFSWHGSLLEDKMDKVGTGFRRNRHYDPQTGRFTQEDPIGLAGGVNLYGFAAGDPVNFRDPFGLCVPLPDCLLAQAERLKVSLVNAAVDGLSAIGEFSGLSSLFRGARGSDEAGNEITGGQRTGEILLGLAAFVPSGQDVALARKLGLKLSSPVGRELFANRGKTVSDFISQFRKARILREFPGEFLNNSVDEALRSGNSRVRKLLTDGRFIK